MNPRHAKPRRPSKDHDVTWSRQCRNGLVTWTLWRRDHRRAIHMRAVTGGPCDIRRAWHELRDFVDEIDLAATEQTT